MTWTIDYAASVYKSTHKLDPKVRRRIHDFLERCFAIKTDPRHLGAPLVLARHRNLWRYRIGDDPIVAEINDAARRIRIVRIAHRASPCCLQPTLPLISVVIPVWTLQSNRVPTVPFPTLKGQRNGIDMYACFFSILSCPDVCKLTAGIRNVRRFGHTGATMVV